MNLKVHNFISVRQSPYLYSYPPPPWFIKVLLNTSTMYILMNISSVKSLLVPQEFLTSSLSYIFYKVLHVKIYL